MFRNFPRAAVLPEALRHGPRAGAFCGRMTGVNMRRCRLSDGEGRGGGLLLRLSVFLAMGGMALLFLMIAAFALPVFLHGGEGGGPLLFIHAFLIINYCNLNTTGKV